MKTTKFVVANTYIHFRVSVPLFLGRYSTHWSGVQSGRWKDLVTEYYHVRKVRLLPMETFLQRIFEIGQCQLMVINNDNTCNGRNKIYQLNNLSDLWS
jgi:hypothetical protein